MSIQRASSLTILGAAIVAITSVYCARNPISADPDSIPANQVVAIRGINIVPMDRDTVLRERTVVIRAGRIEAIMAAGASPPAGAIVIDGKGRFLIPGLIDMHVHARRRDIPLYVAAGITTVRNMWGHEGVRSLQQEIEAGALIGPTIISVSPGIDGQPPQWPATEVLEDPIAADQTVARLAAAGWSAIKVYTNVRKDVFDAVVEAARKYGVDVVGHVPVRVSVDHAVAVGMRSIEHLSGYDRAVSATGRNGTFGWADADTTRFAALIQQTRQSGVWICPTLAIYDELAKQQPAPERDRVIRNEGIFVRRLAAAGVPLLAGTDAGIDVVPAGFTLQSELEHFVAAGVSPFTALAAATSNAARFLGLQDVGIVRAGNRADLVLLESNPLIDIAATRRVSAVIIRGWWLAGSQLSGQQ